MTLVHRWSAAYGLVDDGGGENNSAGLRLLCTVGHTASNDVGGCSGGVQTP